jgi:tetratricopeptide (TPR) repeat protein
MLASSCALFSVALLSKENAIVVPLLIAIYELLRPDGAEERKLKLILPFCAIAAAYMLWRSQIVPASLSFSGGLTELCLRLMTAARIAGSYFHMALLPHDLGFETYTSITDSIGDPKALAWVVAVILAVGAVAWLSRRNPKLGFFAIWFFACLTPFGYFVLFHPGPELFTPPHFLYLPLVGLVGIAGAGLAGLMKKNGSKPWLARPKAGFALAGLAVLLFSAQTMQRNTTWRDNFTFFTAMRKHAPQSARIRIGLANALMTRGQPAHALAEYAAAWKLARSEPEEEPEYLSAPPEAEGVVGRLKISNYYAAVALAGMGDAYRLLGEHENSTTSYERALSENAFDSIIHLKLARAYEHVGRFDEAIKTLERGLRIDPKLPGAASLLEIVREKENVYDEAESVRRKALQAGQADSPESLYSQALIARLSGKGPLAEALLNETLRKDPAHFGANMALGRILHKRGETPAALGNFGAAFAEDPTSALAAYSLAEANLALQDTLAAEQWAAKAYELSPEKRYLDFLEAVRDGEDSQER